ncbi:GGDEF domain-containing protein [Myxococcota bacterium]|nr:GGDEF domain-containing protein [Myxococcota bacterium]MBU1510895.1 GGDEF domain-containing protein [Myxococcota bacterium]
MNTNPPDRPGPSDIPAEILRAARLAPLPVYLRELFGRLPESLELTAELGSLDGPLPLAARQLLKLSLFSDQLHLRAARLVDGMGLRLVVSRGMRTWTPGDGELTQGIECVVQGILGALLSVTESSLLLSRFAFQSSNLATLSTITRFMLRSTDEDQAMHVLLSGITSGYSLGFNRAALFVWDEVTQRFAGSKGIGPFDDAEAHRIWEAIEIEDKDIDALIRDYDRRNFDTRFQQLVQSITLTPGLDDEIWQALGADGPLLVRRPRAINEDLARLDVRDEYVLAVLRPHGRILGLVLADNRHNRLPVSTDQFSHFSFFIDQTALVWENLALLRRVEELARVDGLTGTLNRRELETRLRTELARCQRHGRPCSLMIADLDFFKQVNDSGGHEAGDEVLRRFGRLLRDTMRADDVVGRYGGDEFVVVLPETGPDQLGNCAIRLGNLAAGAGISLSIGGATWPADCADPTGLVGVSDACLYQAKRQGRGRACIPGREAVPFDPISKA